MYWQHVYSTLRVVSRSVRNTLHSLKTFRATNSLKRSTEASLCIPKRDSNQMPASRCDGVTAGTRSAFPRSLGPTWIPLRYVEMSKTVSPLP